MNLGFAVWVASRKIVSRDDVRVMFHEVAFPWVRRPLRHNLLAAVQRVMAWVVLQSCTFVYVSIPSWEDLLRPLGGSHVQIDWTPVPANVPGEAARDEVAALRERLTGSDSEVKLVGHFGSYGKAITELLAPVLAEIVEGHSNVRVVLMGYHSEEWRDTLLRVRPEWASRIIAVGARPAQEVATHVRACDLLVQPYPDGASSRRGSLMAGLCNETAVLTNLGPLSEPIWSGGAVALAPVGRMGETAIELLADPSRLGRLGSDGRRLYSETFTIEQTVRTLLHGAPIAGESAKRPERSAP